MTLPTPLPTLRRASNAYANTAANRLPTPSNTAANRVLPTPHTPLRLETPLWALRPAEFRPLRREGTERPHHRQHTNNVHAVASADRIMPPLLRRITRYSRRSASHLLPGTVSATAEPLQATAITAVCRSLPCVDGSSEDLFASDAWRGLSSGDGPAKFPETTRHPTGVPRRMERARQLDLLSIFRGRF